MDSDSLYKTLPSSGACPICAVVFTRLSTHFHACARKRIALLIEAVELAKTPQSVGKHSCVKYKCEHCNSTFKSLLSKYYANHVRKLHSKAIASECQFLPLVGETFFDESTDNILHDLDDNAWLDPIKQFCTSAGKRPFTFAHININSMFNKLHSRL